MIRLDLPIVVAVGCIIALVVPPANRIALHRFVCCLNFDSVTIPDGRMPIVVLLGIEYVIGFAANHYHVSPSR